MKKEIKRICVYPKDIQLITGKSYRQSVRILENIRKFYKKSKHNYVSIREVSLYLGLDYEELLTFVK